MKNLFILTILITLFCGELKAQPVPRPDVCKACVLYVYPEFQVIKDTVTRQTIIESYDVIGDSVKKGTPQFSRKKFKFHADPGQIDMTDDYYKSTYAIGHVNSAKNNAAHIGSLKHSMLWINTNLQQQSMNAGPWLGLEDHERDEAVRLSVIHVKAGVYGNIGFTKPADKKHLNTHHAIIPGYWWKALCYKDSTVVWVMPNVIMPQHTADYTKPEFKKSVKFLTDTIGIKVDALR
jgi:DNA/RNA endonuclease G (NUC1)